MEQNETKDKVIVLDGALAGHLVSLMDVALKHGGMQIMPIVNQLQQSMTLIPKEEFKKLTAKEEEPVKEETEEQ